MPSERAVSHLGLAVDNVKVDSSYWVKLSWFPILDRKKQTSRKVQTYGQERTKNPGKEKEKKRRFMPPSQPLFIS